MCEDDDFPGGRFCLVFLNLTSVSQYINSCLRCLKTAVKKTLPSFSDSSKDWLGVFFFNVNLNGATVLTVILALSWCRIFVSRRL